MVDDAVLDLTALLPNAQWATDMIRLLEAGPDALRQVRSASAEAAGSARLPLDRVHLLAPIPRPRKNVFCVGLNYLDHAKEAARGSGRPLKLPTSPVYFTKPPTGIIGPDANIMLDESVTKELDYEVEFAIVIGVAGVNIPESEAMAHVFGYTIVNDISARDVQRRHGQWFKGKSLDTGCPLGPWIVPTADMPDPANLDVSLRVNGQVMQSSNTRQFLFSLARLVSDLSIGMTLEPGDIIATGTPGGVGYARTPPFFLKDGDVVEAEVQGIGVLRNPVRAVK